MPRQRNEAVITEPEAQRLSEVVIRDEDRANPYAVQDAVTKIRRAILEAIKDRGPITVALMRQ